MDKTGWVLEQINFLLMGFYVLKNKAILTSSSLQKIFENMFLVITSVKYIFSVLGRQLQPAGLGDNGFLRH
jgi:hypothetical protein